MKLQSKPAGQPDAQASALPSFPTPVMQQPQFPGRMHNAHPDGDEAIRQIDSDAAVARLSAVQKGYISDPFVKYLLPRGAHLQPARPPLINIGTYVRSEGIDQLVNEWLELSEREGRQCQIVSLGAGSDTRFWRIAVRHHLVIWMPCFEDVFDHAPKPGRLASECSG